MCSNLDILGVRNYFGWRKENRMSLLVGLESWEILLSIEVALSGKGDSATGSLVCYENYECCRTVSVMLLGFSIIAFEKDMLPFLTVPS